MIHLSKLNFLGSFLSLTLICSTGTMVLTSCSKDSDEPEIINPAPKPEEPGKEDPENPEENPKEEEKPTDEVPIPDFFSDPYAYVVLPEDIPQQYKEYTGFTVSFNKDNHTPNYVAWELLNTETTGSANRNDVDFWQDTELEGCPTKDYAYSTYGYERGHMCPAADQKWSLAAMKDCFSMANMCPQLREINAGAWETLEEKERAWAKRDKAIWIIAGPIYYDTDDLRIGAYKVRVPSAFFKAFLYKDTDDPRAIAFVYPNADAPGNMEDYAMSIDELEKELGYDFFPALPDEIENRIEATYSFSDWNK